MIIAFGFKASRYINDHRILMTKMQNCLSELKKNYTDIEKSYNIINSNLEMRISKINIIY